MPILKREPDQYPPDLMKSEYESLKKAQNAVTLAASHLRSDAESQPGDAESQAGDAESQAGDAFDVSQQDLGDLEEPEGFGVSGGNGANGLLEVGGRGRSERAGKLGEGLDPCDGASAGGGSGILTLCDHDFGSFSYYTEYLGVENPSKPLTFWSGDWDDFQKFDPAAEGWWCLYTHSRQEKMLMRHLMDRKLSFYCPLIEKRYRSPQGRIRSSFLPLFTNYVFLRGTDDDRRLALATNCVLTSKPIQQPDYLVSDLFQISVAVESGVPITAEQKLEKGAPVRVKSGPFKGFEGFVQRRAGATRFLIFLRYLQQGVSMEIDEGALVAM